MICLYEENRECLPDIIVCEDVNRWEEYLDYLYENIFKPCILNGSLTFRGKPILPRREPLENGKEHGFIHMTKKEIKNGKGNHYDPNNRFIDLRRSERLVWVKSIITNYPFCELQDCDYICYWEEMFRGRVRLNFLLPDDHFQLVLEYNNSLNIYYIITSFYLDHEYEVEKRLKKYELYKKQKTPLT